MIKLGSDIKGLNIGSARINKLYLGEKIIWEKSKPRIFEGNYRYDIDLTDSDYFKPNTKYKFIASFSDNYNYLCTFKGGIKSGKFNTDFILSTENYDVISIVNSNNRVFVLTIEEV